MLETALGIVNCCKEEQFEKQRLRSMLFIVSGMVMCSNDSQYENAQDSMWVTEFGMLISP